tara:strand:- start:3269 stop:5194 length:1926 start_codon:yes stop_codon:yes gene_type:complete
MASNIEIGAKAADGTLTIREALSIRKNPGATLNRIKAMGYDLDDNWSTVSTDKFLRDLDTQGKNAQFVELGAAEQQLRKLAAQSEEGAEYSYKIGYGASGRATELELATAVQPRGTSEAGQSRVKPKAVPPAQDAIPAFIKGINAIPDPQTRAAVAFNFLVPLRPGEVGQIGIDDFDFETGQFKEEWRRGKKIRGAIQLPEVALEILRDAHAEAVANGQSVIFDRTTAQMTAATKVSGGIRDQFKQYEKILGGGKPRPFVGASDIRKIVPSLMVGELNMGITVSTVMGHASYDEMMGSVKKMTAANYISPIETGEGSAERQALNGLHNMMAEVMGLETLNELPASLNVSANNLTAVGSPKLQVLPRGSDIVPTAANQNVGPLTEVDVELLDEVRNARRSELRASAAASDLQAALDENAAVEARASIDQEKIDQAVAKSEALAAAKNQSKEAAAAAKKEQSAGMFDDFLADMAEEFSSAKKTLKSSAIAAAATGVAMAKSAPGPLFDLIGGVVDKESYDIAEQKGQRFVSELTGQPEDSFVSRMGGGAGVVGEMVTGAVADPEGAGKTALQMASVLGMVPQIDFSQQAADAPAPSIPDPAPPAPEMAAQGFVPVPEARANAMRGETTAMDQAPSFLYGGVVR